MAEKEKFRILRTINRVFKNAKGSKLSKTFFKQIDSDLKILQNYFELSEQETLIITLVFALNHESNNPVGITEIARLLKSSTIKFMEYKVHFNALVNLGILKKSFFNHRHMRRNGFANEQYVINDSLSDAVLNEKPMLEIESGNYTDVIDLLEKISALLNQEERELVNTTQLLEESSQLINSHTQFSLINKIIRYKLSDFEMLLLINLIWRTLIGEEVVDLSYSIREIIDNPSQRVRYTQNFLKGDSDLIKKNLIDVVDSEFINNADIMLASNSLELLKEEGIELFGVKKKEKSIIEPAKIGVKQLFFNNATQMQIKLLEESIKQKYLVEIQNRLKKKHLPTGINVLLYGYPGTGKTELVYQLARKTKREVMHIDISQTKSKWFGDSEKIIKKVFSDYSTYLYKNEIAPILLFNEADAVISTRRDHSTNVSQTENAIQNIILEELEKFEGLFFATTNLVKNFDSAFERRFLFKIEFKKPDDVIKAKIWKSKLKEFDLSDCQVLAKSYDLTGGQIDNIIRKSEMTEIINGTKTNLKMLLEFCDQEQLAKEHNSSIGFNRINRVIKC